MDIFNRPPSIAEDAVQYSIHLPSDASDKTSAMTFAACILNFVESLLTGFIWHRDTFEVKVLPNPEKSGSWILEGRIRVGDSIDDEWCTVWLLKEISSKWDVIISVYDSDGEFLLIEAAEALPSWVKPTNSENRVWIRNSRLHLIPLTHVSPGSKETYRRRSNADSDDEISGAADDDEFITVSDALRVVRDPLCNTLAPPAVEEIVWKRIQDYPSALKIHVHMTKAYVPQDIVKALSINPALIQKAVETFYTRDAIELRAAHRMSRFSPHDLVLASVGLTRTAYAQLSGQKFFPPKIFEWKEPEGTSEWRWKNIGMKIAVGFEMLYQESKPRQTSKSLASDGVFASSETLKEALQRDPEYKEYIENLVSANYFKGELRDSELWKTLENKAVTAFVDARRADDVSRPSFAALVDFAVSNANPLAESFDFGEDSEEWLSIDAEDFDHMLENKTGKTSKRDSNPMDVDDAEPTQPTEDSLTSQQAKRLKHLADKVEAFIEGEGDVEGATFEDEEFSDEPFSDDDTSDSVSEPESAAGSEKGNTERQAAMDKLVPALGPSEYGVMPSSYHENSQRIAARVTSDAVEEKPTAESPTEGPKATKSKPVRPPIISRDKYDGVDSDDETDMEDDSEEDERPQIVGEVEIDMNEEEEDFLEFSRQALGINDEHWAQIIEDRKKRGAFLPPSTTKSPTSSKPDSSQKGEESARRMQSACSMPERSSQSETKPNLESFEAVMKALDDVLAQNQSHKPSNVGATVQSKKNTKGKKKATIEDEMAMEEDPDFDFEAAMEAELKEVLERDDTDLGDPVDYNLIKNFLESFKSQEGLSGPVSNLVGRLVPDFKLPRDHS